MINFEDSRVVERGVEGYMDPNIVELLCSGDKFHVSGRPLLRETPGQIFTHEAEVIELEVVVHRLFMRPDISLGHNHLAEEFTQELPVLACKTFDGCDVLFGMTKALDFDLKILG